MAVEYRPEDTKEEVIGGTLISEDSRTNLRSKCMLAVIETEVLKYRWLLCVLNIWLNG